MISFLTCNAKAVLRLILEINYQEKNRIINKSFEVDNKTTYKITVADNMAGLRTYNGRIIGYTMCPEEEVLSFVNSNTKPTVVDIRAFQFCNVLQLQTIYTSSNLNFVSSVLSR